MFKEICFAKKAQKKNSTAINSAAGMSETEDGNTNSNNGNI